jgi:peptidoglycan hydrolase-like protein with peptidoglycan-binding domain
MVAAMALASGIAGAQTTPTKSKSTASKSKSKGKSSRHKSAHSKSGKTQSVSAKSGTTGKGSKKYRARRGAWKRKGQQKIDGDRTRQIQEALIREKYMQGEPTGVWDSSTEQAMTRYQSDHGWQSKVTPDSRAIIKLGLGPDHSQDSVGIPGTKAGGPVSAITAPMPATAPRR